MTREQMEAHLALSGWQPRRIDAEAAPYASPYELVNDTHAILKLNILQRDGNTIWRKYARTEPMSRTDISFAEIPDKDFQSMAFIACPDIEVIPNLR